MEKCLFYQGKWWLLHNHGERTFVLDDKYTFPLSELDAFYDLLYAPTSKD